jgi:hypothetical protein
MRIFLGGTCNESTWRDELIKMLDTYDYFNPVVEDWTPACQVEELRQREMAEYVVYVITPRMSGVYSIAEVVDDSNKRPEKTILCVTTDPDYFFTAGQDRSLEAVKDLVAKNGGTVCATLNELACYLNEHVQDPKVN